MLDEYSMDPAFNKNLVFAYQPPPEIDASKLPILIKYWLEHLQEIICTADSELPKNILDKHVGERSEYFAKKPLLEYLKLIYHRLQGHLDSELGALSENKRLDIINKLSEEIIHCSEGFHNRINIIVDSFLKPRNLAELLYMVRRELVKETASTLTNEVHAWNRVSVIAANDGLGVKVNFPDDTYSGALAETSIRRALQHTFQNKFTPFNLPCLLTAAFRKFIPELEGEKNAEHGICLQTQDKIKTLLKLFLPNYINEKPNNPNNWKNYFITYRNEKNPLIFSFVNLNWEKIYQSFYLALSEQKYFINPQINTLIDSAYYSLFIIKKLYTPTELISKFFKEGRYFNLLEQLVELNTKFPDYYQKISKNRIFSKNGLDFTDYLTQQLKVSCKYSSEIIQGFQLLLHLDLRRKDFIIKKIADSLLVKNRAGFNLLMLAAQCKPSLANDILAFLKTNEKIIDAELTEEMFLMKNKDNSNALMIAASKQTEAIVSILSFLTTNISHFANDTLRSLFTQQQKDSCTAVSITARDHPDRLKNILSFITNHIKIDRNTLRKLLFSENSDGACTALMLAVKNQAEATYLILKFISKNIRNFDPEILRKMFLEKDQDGFTILMLAARYHPKALEYLLTFINDFHQFFPVKNLPTLFLEKNPENNNCLMLASEFQPLSVPTILYFINQKIESFKPYLAEILFAKNTKDYNSLILTRHHPEAMAALLNFINTQQDVLPLTLEEIFLEKYDLGFSILMLTSRDCPKSLNLILEFIYDKTRFASILPQLLFEKNQLEYTSLMLATRTQYEGVAYILGFIERHPTIFTPLLIRQLLLASDKDKINTLMIAIRHQPQAVKFYLDFIQKHTEIFSPSFFNEFLLAHDKHGVNALMAAATYHSEVIKLLLDFLSRNIEHFNNHAIYEFVFKKISDHSAGFIFGLYTKKSVFSVTTQLEDRTAINALLRFVDEHIELIGLQTLTELLTEKYNQNYYIFGPACSRYPFVMKGVLDFISDPVNSKNLAPIQDLSAHFIFEQFAKWSIETDDDHNLLNKVILNCSALLLIYFNKDYFVEQPNNLKVVTDKLFNCYLNELEDRKIKRINYTTKFSFFKWRYSTTQKLEAARALEKVVTSKTIIDKIPALMRLKDQYSALSESRLGNLFAAYQEIAEPKAEEVYEFYLTNEPQYLKLAMIG